MKIISIGVWVFLCGAIAISNGVPQVRQIRKGPIINLFIKRPEINHEAKLEPMKSVAEGPTVTLQYEPLEKVVIHYPYDKPYSPLSDLIVPSVKSSNVIKNDTSATANDTTSSSLNAVLANNVTKI